MDKKFRLCKGLKGVPLPVLFDPQEELLDLLYPTNHYVIIKNVISDGNSEYGEISDQSMLMFMSPQEKVLAQDYSTCYLTLIQQGIIYLTRLL